MRKGKNENTKMIEKKTNTRTGEGEECQTGFQGKVTAKEAMKLVRDVAASFYAHLDEAWVIAYPTKSRGEE